MRIIKEWVAPLKTIYTNRIQLIAIISAERMAKMLTKCFVRIDWKTLSYTGHSTDSPYIHNLSPGFNTFLLIR